MTNLFRISATDLAALLSSRICHDVISPVGAINNGLELLNDGIAPEEALKLIQMGAENASAKLQFLRLAFGAFGGIESMIDTSDAQAVAQTFIAHEKSELFWEGERSLLPGKKVKLLLNLFLIAQGAIPQGGKISVHLSEDNKKPKFVIECSGSIVRISPIFLELHSTGPLEKPIDAHSIQPYYTLLIAEEAGMHISIEKSTTEAKFTAISGQS